VLRKITIKIEGVCSFLTYPGTLLLTYPIPMTEPTGSISMQKLLSALKEKAL
jgi:hypothetical protein